MRIERLLAHPLTANPCEIEEVARRRAEWQEPRQAHRREVGERQQRGIGATDVHILVSLSRSRVKYVYMFRPMFRAIHPEFDEYRLGSNDGEFPADNKPTETCV